MGAPREKDMTRICPNCMSELDKRSVLYLKVGLSRRCAICGEKLKISQIWMFVLSMFTVFVMVASLGFVNYMGLYGFFLAGAVTLSVFLVGVQFVPLITDK